MKAAIVLCAVLAAPGLQAWNCSHSKQIDQVLDLSGSDGLVIEAMAGDLEVSGYGGDDAVIRGKVCVSEEEWLAKANVVTSDGKLARISVDLPDTSGWSLTGSNYAYIDLELTVPDNIAVSVKDSSGDADISGLASLEVSDSSGDLKIQDIDGVVTVNDSSGDLEIEDIGGTVNIANDSSGDIEIRNVTGSVLIENDSSGSIYVSEVSDDVMVGRDSSGDITADGVGGSFTVRRDGSGDIRALNVEGEVDIPEKS
jgi:hypothetical protein